MTKYVPKSDSPEPGTAETVIYVPEESVEVNETTGESGDDMSPTVEAGKPKSDD